MTLPGWGQKVLGQRHRLWPNIETEMGQRHV